MIEPSLSDWLPLPINPGHDVIPAQRPRSLVRTRESTDKTMYPSSRVP